MNDIIFLEQMASPETGVAILGFIIGTLIRTLHNTRHDRRPGRPHT